MNEERCVCHDNKGQGKMRITKRYMKSLLPWQPKLRANLITKHNLISCQTKYTANYVFEIAVSIVLKLLVNKDNKTLPEAAVALATNVTTK
jgi:hypothetical protein